MCEKRPCGHEYGVRHECMRGCVREGYVCEGCVREGCVCEGCVHEGCVHEGCVCV